MRPFCLKCDNESFDIKVIPTEHDFRDGMVITIDSEANICDICGHENWTDEQVDRAIEKALKERERQLKERNENIQNENIQRAIC